MIESRSCRRSPVVKMMSPIVVGVDGSKELSAVIEFGGRNDATALDE